MSVRPFPRRSEPRKRLLLIPVVLIFGGLALTFIPYLQFLGIVISLAGALSLFLVGMIMGDMWAASRRLSKIGREHDEKGSLDDAAENDIDPFEDLLSQEKE